MYWTKKQITSKLDQFRNWLAANGAQVMEPTNEWEIVRFKAGDTTGIIYAKATGEATLTGAAIEAWPAFKGSHSWRAAPATRRKQKSPARIQAIRQRDGDGCFFCLLPVSVEDESEEHLVPITHQGPNHISNIFLAHRVCNAKAGHLSAPEKIRLHVEAHLKRAIPTPAIGGSMTEVTEQQALEPEADQKDRGLYDKFEVRRTDGSSDPGGRHEHDEFFVLNMTTDKHAIPALRAYAASCAPESPKLAADLNAIVRAARKDEFVTIPETTLPNGQIVPRFQVGKYMSFVNDAGEAEVRADVVPTVYISYHEARAACKKAGYELLTETQALALARHIATVGANWSGGSVGEGNLKQGLHDGTVDEVQRNDYVPEEVHENRTFMLADGSKIDDAAGHIYSWIFDDIQGDENGIVARPFASDSPSITSSPFPSCEHGVGWYPGADVNWSGRALVRGGFWSSEDRAGVFSLGSDGPSDAGVDVGFRCTKPISL